MLVIFSGLPAVGKSAIARELARQIGAVYLRVDTIEQTMRDWMPEREISREGYEVMYALAAENLSLGLRVIADSVNPVELTRATWRSVAAKQNAPYVEIEVKCSDRVAHRQRAENRASDIPGLRLPTWAEIMAGNYHPWTRDRLIIDTAVLSVQEAVKKIRGALAG
ncbi:MAG: AAA family ATPase [Deltaproteobacteria bacterium]|nr:AAA family ATPase [Deltaproteobacteria bacterium]